MKMDSNSLQTQGKANSCNDLISFETEEDKKRSLPSNSMTVSEFVEKRRSGTTANARPSRPPPPVPIHPNNISVKINNNNRQGSSSSMKLKTANSSFYVDNATSIQKQSFQSMPNLEDVQITQQSKPTTAQLLAGHREQNMKLFMEKRREDYTVKKPYHIFIGTWNVNGQLPPTSLAKWLAVDKEPPDLYYIGFQELDLSKEAMVFAESLREDSWISVVEKSLHPGARYYIVSRIRLVGMMLLVFAQDEHSDAIKEQSQHHVGTGIMGRMGNKGGVGVRFALHSSTICAVNTHLAAHMEEVERRNQDYRDICSRLRFPIQDLSPVLIGQHDILFWLGDMNYRIQDLEADYVKSQIEEKNYKLLKEKDQLLMQKSSGMVFESFTEGEINFRPTYKYDPGTDNWDTSEKCRPPAWCDRILWWEQAFSFKNTGSAQSMVEQLRYDSHMELKISDHKPVSALFKIMISVVDKDKYKRVFEEENRRLDRLENEYLPTMVLDSHEVNFGEVKFQEARRGSVSLMNTGQIPCNFEFISKPNEEIICPPWLSISKSTGVLFPGESYRIEFEVYVNRTTATDLNCGSKTLEDILILHLIGGKDFFITVTGRYLPSCFGTSIEALCRMKKPIREIPTKEILELSKIPATRINDADEISEPELFIPKELWRIIDHLYRNAKKQEDLFQQPGLHFEVSEIRDCLDTTVETESKLLPGSNHSVAEALLLLLEALPEPVIPFHLYRPCLQVQVDFMNCKEVLRGLSIRHRNTFKYLMSFLRELLKYKSQNNLDINLLASVFSGLMLRSPPKHRQKDRMAARIERENATKFIMQFLRHEYDE